MHHHYQAVRGPIRFTNPLRPSISRTPAPGHLTKSSTTCSSEEAQRWFFKRLESSGYSRDLLLLQPQHPLVQETWKAMQEVYGLGVLETPLLPAPWLHAFSGAPTGSVHLKMESTQVTGSFKARGAAHKLLSLTPEQLQKGIITCSTGNHASAVLHAVTALQKASSGRTVDLEVYIPSTVTPQKVAKLESAAEKCGARIIVVGQDCVEAEIAARAAATAAGKTYISPYNDYAVAGGQGTLAVELLFSLPPTKLDVVFVPVGGGGLIAGVAALLKHMVGPSVTIIGCQPERSDVMRRSVEAGSVVELSWEETLSDATAGGIEEDSLTLAACTEFVDEWVTVTETEIASALVKAHGEGLVIEGSAGVAVASYLKLAERMKGKDAVVVVCGGNVAVDVLDKAYEIVLKSRLLNAG